MEETKQIEPIKTMLREKSGKTEKEIEKMIEQKKTKFAGLLTETGALFLIAKELGIEFNLKNTIKEELLLNQIEEGMKNFDVAVKVNRVFAPRETEGKNGKASYCNLEVFDSTEKTILTLWNKDIEKISSLGIKEESVILIKNCSAAKFREKKQLKLSPVSEIILNPVTKKEFESQKTRKISDLLKEESNQEAIITATIIQAKNSRLFFEQCPNCYSKLIEKENKNYCEKCDSEKKPKKNLFFKTTIDDGTATIDCIAFSENAEKMIGIEQTQLLEMEQTQGTHFVIKEIEKETIGKRIKINGIIKKNKFGEKEFMCKKIFERVE